MGARGLLSRLSSRDPGRPIDEVTSIVNNLRVLLNTRVGDSLSAVGFGVADFVDMVHEFPYASGTMQKGIRAAITEYEPRLRNVRVRPIPSEDPLTLAFEVSARLSSDRKRGLVRVQTRVSHGGRIKVE